VAPVATDVAAVPALVGAVTAAGPFASAVAREAAGLLLSSLLAFGNVTSLLLLSIASEAPTGGAGPAAGAASAVTAADAFTSTVASDGVGCLSCSSFAVGSGATLLAASIGFTCDGSIAAVPVIELAGGAVSIGAGASATAVVIGSFG
jgi:hypothetical protein